MKDQKKAKDTGLTEVLKNRLQGFKEFPYASKISFVPLIRRLKTLGTCQSILAAIEKYPEMSQSIEDPDFLVQHMDVVDLLMTTIFPAGSGNALLGRAMGPFDLGHFYLTEGLYDLLYNKNMKLTLERSLHQDQNMTIVHAGLRILKLHYGFEVSFEMPFIFSAKIGERDRFFKADMNLDFVDLKINGTPPEIDEATFNLLIKNIYNDKLWLEKLPPSIFEFHGFVTGQLFDVTQEEALSRLKQKLLEKDGVLNKNNIREMEQLLCTFFEIPDLKLGLTAVDYPLENSILHRYKIRYDFLADEVERLLDPEFTNSIYHRACHYRTEVIIEDLLDAKPKTALEQKLIKKGINSILVVPLISNDDEIIGILEMGHVLPFGFNYFHRMYMKEITDLFRLAVERSRNEVDNQIEAIIREKYTAIHPSVEWKFVQSAFDYLEASEKSDSQINLAEIAFPEVYPLYGQADIVGSSVIRGGAIREDMILNLGLILTLLRRAKKVVNFPLVDKYVIDIEKEIETLKSTTTLNNENVVQSYIKDQLHPLLEQLEGMNEKVIELVTAYKNELHPEVGLIFRRRKEYEDSVAILNNILSHHLERTQRDAQKMIPHYFEKYKTDGVEYDIYIGQSILNHGKFDQVQLKNIRLWQLINMCELTRLSEERGARLPIALRTAQLIFVNESPIAIRFRSDEKQFDIDGAYNVRYEIIKKRIDKSVVVGTNERLTVAGRVAIVYTGDASKSEYLDYLNYLMSAGYIEDEIEDLEVGALQGVEGLRALRVTVKLKMQEKEKLKIA